MTVLLVGDCMFGRLVNGHLEHCPPDYPWGDTLPLFAAADLRLINLECALADDGNPWSFTPKVFHFRSDRKNVAVLQAARIGAVSLANNHTLDFDYEGLSETLETLDAANIPHAGAGENRAAAEAPVYLSARGVRVGFLAASDNEPEWQPTPKKAGVRYVPVSLSDPRAVRLLKQVREVSATVDLLIVSLHWGSNWGCDPETAHPAFARALIDCGAGIVYGHSCHITRGIEVYKGRPILYGTGDFIDDYAIDEIERNDQSFVFLVDLDGPSISRLRLYPTRIAHLQAVRATGAEAEAIAARMQRLCANLGTPARWNDKAGCLEIEIPPNDS